MASDRRLELRVTRLENDRDALYDLISDIQTTLAEHTRRLDGIDIRLGRIDQRFDGIDATLVEILRRLPEPA